MLIGLAFILVFYAVLSNKLLENESEDLRNQLKELHSKLDME